MSISSDDSEVEPVLDGNILCVLDFDCSMDNMSVSSDDSKVESVVNERGVFMLGPSDTELQIVEKLQRLRKENHPTEIFFHIWGIQWTGRIASEIIQTFEHYANANLRWNQADFIDSDESEPFFRVVETAAKLKLFRQLRFSNSQTSLDGNPGLSLTTRLAFALASVFREGGLRGLKGVILCDFEISANAMAVLATGLATTGQTVGLSNLVFIDCPFIGRDESGGLMGAPEYLAAGLASNTTLKKLELSDCMLNDSSLAGIVRALSRHPSLEVLKLEGCEYGRETMESIHQWLRSDSCQLRELHMDGGEDGAEDGGEDGGWEHGTNEGMIQHFVEDLPLNTSLESLSISHHASHINAEAMNLLLRNLSKLPNLRYLDVNLNMISDFVSLGANLANAMPAHRLRCLDLDHNDWFNGLKEAMQDDDLVENSILQLLDVFPELGFLGDRFERVIQEGIVPSHVGLRLDRNRCFGLLQRGATTIPLSVWPVVIGKVNKDRFLVRRPSSRATILYEMLHGPAFVGRGSL